MLHDGYTILWLIFAAVWLMAGRSVKRTVKRETLAQWVVHSILVGLAFLLLFEPRVFGELDRRVLPDSPDVFLCGLALTAAGLALAIWARLLLGRNWSGAVTIKQDHELIRQGPYRFVRHPIYSGVLLAALGTAIGYGTLAGLFAIPIAFLAFWVKSRTEERFMRAQFGEQYVQYQHEVRAFIPGIL